MIRDVITDGQILWLENSEEGKQYPKSTWYRCIGIESFYNKIVKEHNIVGIVLDHNNIGFILEDK